MKVQPIDTYKGERYILLDDDYEVINEVKRYLLFLDARNKSPNTLKNYAHHLKLFYEYMNNMGLDIKEIASNPDIGPIEILSNFMLYLQFPDYNAKIIPFNGVQQKRSNSTINDIMSCVLGFYQYLAANKEIEELDIYKEKMNSSLSKSFISELIYNKTTLKQSIFKMRKIDEKPKYITKEQYKELFNVCTNIRDKLIIALCYECGLRIGEVLGIHIQDLNIKKQELNIVPRENNKNGARVKNYAAGKVYLKKYVRELLNEYILNIRSKYDGEYLFISLTGNNKGNPLSINATERMFSKLKEKVNFDIHAHILRHSFACNMISYGWDIYKVSKYLRHKSIAATNIYLHMTIEFQDKLREEIFETEDIYEINKIKEMIE